MHGKLYIVALWSCSSGMERLNSIILHSGTFLFTVAKAYILSTENLSFYILYEFILLCSRDLLCKDSLAIVLKALVPEYGTWYMLDSGNVL